jgi:hypothetical protein
MIRARVAAVALLCAAAVVMCPPEAAAQAPVSPACGPRKAVLEQLGREYGEVPVAHGVTAEGALMEMLASPSGSWTLLISLPNGQTCLAATGDSYETIDDAKLPKGEGI